MAKKDKKKSKKKDNPGADAVGAVRSAVEKTFQATADSAHTTRTRAQDLVDEVASASKRVREMIDQIGVLEDLKKQVDALSSRVAALEKSESSSSSSPARRTTASRSTASRSKSTTAAKKPAARKPAARKPAASRSASTSSRSTAAKSTGTTRKTTRSSPAKT